MICGRCGTPNPDGVSACTQCGSVLADERPTLDGSRGATPRGSEDQTLDGSVAPGSSGHRRTERVAPTVGNRDSSARLSAADLRVLPEGFEIGQRYRVVKLLGRGGMGAVYKVRDLELNRDIALKIIRPDIADSASTLERFKREIHLASTITHRNVLRVYDLGEGDGVKFVTMQFVEGEDLAGLIRRSGKLPLPKLLDVLRQTCQGLAAAHEQNVIHRDLKPQNVMLDGAGAVYLTDFGLAKTTGDSGLTETGMLLGTPHYMSPEQVRAEEVDARSDIYSLGVILYEMATGELPFSGGSAFEVMMRRLQKQPRPVGDINPDVPPYLRRILDRCLATDVKTRYQSVAEILADLDAAGSPRPAAGGPASPGRRWAMVAGAILLAGALVAGGWWLRTTRAPGEAKPQPARSVLIADFANGTGDPVFDGTLEPALSVALEGAPFITSYSRPAARRLAAQLQPGASRIDEALARLIAGREGIEIITSGSVERKGGGYAISLSVIDALNGKLLATETAEVGGKEGVLATVTKLAARVRKALGDTTPESAQIAAGETFTAASLEAAHEYGLGMEAQYAGRWDEALDHYRKALALDPNLGRAYAGMAVIENNRGRHQEAERDFKEAMAHIDRMSEREKRRSRGAYFLSVTRDPDKAIEEYGALVEQYPADTAGLANLAVAYQLKRDFGRALEKGRAAIAIYPKNVPQRNNVGLFAMYAGDFEAAIREQRTVLEQNPSFASGYAGLALAQLASGQRDEAAATWRKLEGLGPDGASQAAGGLADLALYEGRVGEAQAILEKAIEADFARKDPDAAARKLVAFGEALLVRGQAARASAAAERARTASEQDFVVFGAAKVLAEAGDGRKALALAEALDQRLQPEAHMYAELVRGLVALEKKDLREAVSRLTASLKVTDLWLTRLALGRAYLAAGAFTEAHGELEQCVKRRGEATDVSLDVVPTYRLFPPVQYFLGRVREGLKSPAAAEAYEAFLAIKANGDGVDPLVADARKRLGTR